MQCTWVFSNPYSAVLTINLPTEMESSCVRKTQIVQHINLFLLKKKETCYRLKNYRSTGSQPEMKYGSETVLDDLADVGSVHCSGRRGQHILYLLHSLYMSNLDVES